MNKLNINKPLILLLVFLGYLISIYLKDKKYFNKESTVYGVAKIKEFIIKKSLFYEYEYYVDDEKYNNHYGIDEGLRNTDLESKVGKYYYVKYSIIDPSYSNLYINIEVPDSLVGCDTCTWKEAPVYLGD